MTTAPFETATSWRRIAIAGYGVIILTFGVFGGWAVVAQIDRAVIAPGVVALESNRKVIQHLEGGIVRAILVKEGDQVRQGDRLVQFDLTQPQANLDLIRNQLYAALALEARLQAEQQDRREITWPSDLLENRDFPQVTRSISDQESQFRERRSSLKGQIDILEARIHQLSAQVDGIRIEKRSSEEQVKFINDELTGLRQLREKELIPVTRVLAMERERTRLEGQIGRAIADIGKTQSAIGEARLQIQQTRQKFNEEIATQLMETGQRLADLREKMTVADDVLRRLDITAPKKGVIQNVKVSNPGQVIRPGEQLMEIVPQDEALVIQARFTPQDIDGVHLGQQTEIRFDAFHALKPPVMTGELASLSRDRLIDEATQQPYYLGQVSLAAAEIPPELRSRIRAGMSAEVIALFGPRTFAEYLIEPLKRSMRKAFIQH